MKALLFLVTLFGLSHAHLLTNLLTNVQFDLSLYLSSNDLRILASSSILNQDCTIQSIQFISGDS